MFEPSKYKNFTNEEIKKDLEKDGFHPLLIVEDPNDFLDPHKHKESHILVVVDGEMRVKLDDGEVIIKTGDKITLGPNVSHAAYFGKKGCKYFWVEF